MFYKKAIINIPQDGIYKNECYASLENKILIFSVKCQGKIDHKHVMIVSGGGWLCPQFFIDGHWLCYFSCWFWVINKVEVSPPHPSNIRKCNFPINWLHVSGPLIIWCQRHGIPWHHRSCAVKSTLYNTISNNTLERVISLNLPAQN